jgi:hypothetical protein
VQVRAMPLIARILGQAIGRDADDDALGALVQADAAGNAAIADAVLSVAGATGVAAGAATGASDWLQAVAGSRTAQAVMSSVREIMVVSNLAVPNSIEPQLYACRARSASSARVASRFRAVLLGKIALNRDGQPGLTPVLIQAFQ